MLNCLFITKHDIFGSGGGAYASKAYLKLFCSLFTNIDLCLAKECIKNNELIKEEKIFGVEKRSFTKKIIQSPFGIFHRFYDYVKKLNCSNYNFVVLDHSAVSSSFVRFFNSKGIYTITIHHNVEKEFYLSNTSKIYKRFVVLFIQHNEKIAYKNSALNLFLTDYDKEYCEKKYGTCKGKSFVASFFFDENSFFVRKENYEIKYDFVISCTLSSIQNHNMIRNFLSKYETIIRNYKILITGRDPNYELESFVEKYSNVTLIKNPNDIQKIIGMAKIYLCPIEDGGGIKVRCFDAISQLMPAILHENALRGYEELKKQGIFFTYNDGISLKNCMDKVLENYDNFQNFKAQYKTVVCEKYSFQKKREQIKRILEI